jgi:hypothetical protein
MITTTTDPGTCDPVNRSEIVLMPMVHLNPTRGARLGVALVLLGWLVSACGGGGPATPPGPDVTRPAPPIGLTQYGGTATTVTVAWALAGDDSLTGRAAAYEVRYAATPLDDSTWAAATLVSAAPVAHPNPGRLMVTIDGLSEGQPYQVGVVAIDEAGNRSRMSAALEVRPTVMRSLYVRADGTGDYPTINAAVHAALPGDVVLVGPGTYDWFSQATGDTATSMVTVLRDQTDFTIRGEDGAAATKLDARGQGRVLYVTGGTFGSGAERTWAGVTIEGFTFTGGSALGVSGQLGPPWAGAGIAIHLSDTVVRNCVFRDNAATEGGAVWMGGQGGSRLEDCLIENNRADTGGGVLLVNSEPVMGLARCIIRDNHANIAGGGLYAANVGVVMEDLQVYDNVSSDKGGGMYLIALHPGSSLTGCTIVANRGIVGGGLRVATNMTVELRRCLIANALGGGAIAVIDNGNVAAGCCLVFGNVGGNAWPAGYTDLGGNLALNPLLCADHISPTALSPCLPANRAGGDACGLIGALEGGCSN